MDSIKAYYKNTPKYAGVGARKTPADIQAYMSYIGDRLGTAGYILQSGGAYGADTAFEIGCEESNGIYVIFEKHYYRLNLSGYANIGTYKPVHLEAAAEIAATHHPAWATLSPYSKTLITRNTFMILGGDLETPVEFVVCWTPGGKIVGGTGQAIRLANHYNIPVYNLHNVEPTKMLNEVIK